MSKVRNKHGLPRTIPEDVKRQVRQLSKFGCVICRGWICDYEHIDPPFTEAKAHDPKAICLLCPGHHRDVTHKRITKQQVIERYTAVQNNSDVYLPSYKALLAGSIEPRLGRSTFTHVQEPFSLIRYDGENVLTISHIQDEDFGGIRPSISGTICDKNGAPLLVIQDNIVTLARVLFDAQFVGQELTLKASKGLILAKVRFEPPNGVSLQRLKMRHRHLVLNLDDTFAAEVDLARGQVMTAQLPDIEAAGAQAAVAFTSDRSTWVDGIRMAGGEGVQVPGGITLAAGNGGMLIKQMALSVGPTA